MWGVVSRQGQSTKQRHQRRRYSATPEQATPSWEAQHPFWVLTLSCLQYVIFAFLMYSMFVPDVVGDQERTIRQFFENRPFEPVKQYGVAGSSLEDSTSYVRAAEYTVDPPVWSAIETMHDVGTWLLVVVARLWKGAFVGNFNQVFSMELKIVECEMKREADGDYSNLLANTVKDAPLLSQCEQQETFHRYFFRTNSEDYLDGTVVTKFKATTAGVYLTIRLFNGFTRTWISLYYSFEQTSAGGIDKKTWTSDVYLRLTNDVQKILGVCVIYFVVATVCLELVREVWLATVFAQKRTRTAVSNRIETIGPLASCWQGLIEYSRQRGLTCIIKFLKTVFSVFCLCRLLYYPISGPTSALEASQNRDFRVPESSNTQLPILGWPTVMLIIGALVLLLMTLNLLIHLKKIHPDLDVIVETCIAFFTVFYACCLIFFVLWSSWSFANFILFGGRNQSYSTVPRAFQYTFGLFFGKPTSSLTETADDIGARSWVILSVMMLLGCHIVALPVSIASITFFYAFRETKRLTESGHEATGLWIRRKCVKGCQRRCFCFTPDITKFFVENGSPGQVANEKGSNNPTETNTGSISKPAVNACFNNVVPATVTTVSTTTDVAIYWERVLLGIYCIFLPLFILGVVLMLDVNADYHHGVVAAKTAVYPIIRERDTPPPVPYKGDAPHLPDRGVSPPGSFLTYRNITSAASIQLFRDWIHDVVILRLMNAEYYTARHTIPLTNPLIIYLRMYGMSENKDPFTASLWPTFVKEMGTAYQSASLNSRSKDSIAEATIRKFKTLMASKNNAAPVLSDKPSAFGKYIAVESGLETQTGGYILYLFYGDPIATARDLTKLFDRYPAFGALASEAVALWLEYNGDARTYSLNALSSKVSLTGSITTRFQSSPFHESTDSMLYVNPSRPVINLFPNHSFEILLASIVVLFVYGGLLLWLIFLRRWKITRVRALLNLIVFGVAIFILFVMAEFFTPRVEPFWEPMESALARDDFKVPFPSLHTVPGPVVLRPGDLDVGPGYKAIATIFTPNRRRSTRLLTQMDYVKRYRTLLRTVAVTGVFVGIVRLPLFGSAFPGTITSHVPTILYDVRWKLLIVVLVLALITASQLAINFLTSGKMGANSIDYSSLSRAWSSQWLISTAKWNFRYLSESTHLAANQWSIFLTIGSVILWTFVFHSIILAVLLYGLRRVRIQRRERLKLEMQESWNLEVREELTYRCNHKVLTTWRAVVKALQLRKRQTGADGEFAHQIDGFFLKFRLSPVFKETPKSLEDYLKRSILAHNLTRIQKYIAFILLLRCKTYLVLADAENAKELTSGSTQNTQGKERYIRTLNKKLEKVKDQLAVLRDRIDFEKTDFRPDALMVRARPREVADDLIHVSEGKYREAVDQLERHRARQREKRKKRLKALREKDALSHDMEMASALLASAERSTESGAIEPAGVTAFDYIDPTKSKGYQERTRHHRQQHRRRASSAGETDDEEDENDNALYRTSLTSRASGPASRMSQPNRTKGGIQSFFSQAFQAAGTALTGALDEETAAPRDISHGGPPQTQEREEYLTPHRGRRVAGVDERAALLQVRDAKHNNPERTGTKRLVENRLKSRRSQRPSEHKRASKRFDASRATLKPEDDVFAFTVDD